LAKRTNNGPDWTDVEAMMRSIQSASSGVVSLTILPRGIGASGGLRVALAWSESMESVGGVDSMMLSESVWPCKHGCTLDGHVFAGLANLDHQLVKQGRIPTGAE
jgi:hypothetical protein